MCPPAASLADVIGTDCSDEEIFMSLRRIMSGSPLPGNVRIDVNPYHCLPSSELAGDIWFLVYSEESKDKDTKHGFWKAKGDASKIFSDSDIIGWITYREFHEGQAPYGLKTDWAMHEYTMTLRGLCENSKETEAGTLCRLLSGDDQSPNHAKKLKISHPELATENRIHPLHESTNADYITRQGSRRKSHADKDTETEDLSVTQRVENDPKQNQPDYNHCEGGDFLELNDLDTPLTPSSSPRRVENDPKQNQLDYNYFEGGGGNFLELNDLDTPRTPSSSTETMSSNEYFDYLELLQDLEYEHNQDLPPDGPGCKLSISASLKPSEVVMSPVTSGPLVVSIGGSHSPTEELHGTNVCSMTGKAAAGARKDVQEAASSSCTSSGKNSSSPSEEKKVAPARKRTLKKYLCFMPF